MKVGLLIRMLSMGCIAGLLSGTAARANDSIAKLAGKYECQSNDEQAFPVSVKITARDGLPHVETDGLEFMSPTFGETLATIDPNGQMKISDVSFHGTRTNILYQTGGLPNGFFSRVGSLYPFISSETIITKQDDSLFIEYFILLGLLAGNEKLHNPVFEKIVFDHFSKTNRYLKNSTSTRFLIAEPYDKSDELAAVGIWEQSKKEGLLERTVFTCKSID